MKFGILATLFLGVFACKPDYDAPCRASHTEHMDLGTSQLNLWPFTGSDSIYYTNQTGDTLLFESTPIDHWYTLEAYTNNPECPQDYYAFENKYLVITDSVNLFAFHSNIALKPELVTVKAGGQDFTYRFSSLESADSASFDSLQFHGISYLQVFAQVLANGDSLYYHTGKGIVRYKSALKTLTLLP